MPWRTTKAYKGKVSTNLYPKAASVTVYLPHLSSGRPWVGSSVISSTTSIYKKNDNKKFTNIVTKYDDNSYNVVNQSTGYGGLTTFGRTHRLCWRSNWDGAGGYALTLNSVDTVMYFKVTTQKPSKIENLGFTITLNISGKTATLTYNEQNLWAPSNHMISYLNSFSGREKVRYIDVYFSLFMDSATYGVYKTITGSISSWGSWHHINCEILPVTKFRNADSPVNTYNDTLIYAFEQS